MGHFLTYLKIFSRNSRKSLVNEVFKKNLKRDPGLKEWSHEKNSITLLNYLIDQNHIESITDEDKKMIERIIMGQKLLMFNQNDAFPWIYEIVCNSKNSIDVDKFDYITRDSYHVGLKDCCFDFRAIMKSARAINEDICYPAKVNSLLNYEAYLFIVRA